MTLVWHLLTGEFPPDPGGVSDYSAQVAAGLARAGGETHVWASGGTHARRDPDTTAVAAPGVFAHRWKEGWTGAGLTWLDAELARFAAPRRLLVQYSPNAWGERGMNVGFGRWLQARRALGDEVWTMVHEPYYPWQLWDKPTRWLLAAVQRRLIRRVLAASSRIFVSIPAWDRYLTPYAPRPIPSYTWLPVPSNVPVVDHPSKVAELRARLAGDGPLVGSFGTYAVHIRELHSQVLPGLLSGTSAKVILLGRGGESLAAELRQKHPAVGERILAPGNLPPEELSLHLQAVDVLLQPFADGASSRRTTLMAGLAHGRATVTHAGFLTEPLWAESGCVRLVPAGDTEGMQTAARELLASPDMRQALGAKARETYKAHFSLERTIGRLLDG